MNRSVAVKSFAIASAMAVIFAGCKKDEEKHDESKCDHDHGTPAMTSAGAPAGLPAGHPPVPSMPQGSANPDAVVVEVNGVKLTQAEVDRVINPAIVNRMQSGTVPPQQYQAMRQHYQRQYVKDFINTTILSQEAEKRGFKADEKELDKIIADEIEMFKKRAPGMKYEDVLKSMGLTAESRKDTIKSNLQISKMMDDVTKDIEKPEEKEIEKFYKEKEQFFLKTPEQATASHILFTVDAEATDKEKKDIKKKADKIRKKIIKGADFGELAAEHSACPSGKRDKGSLGSFRRGEMVPEFDKAAFEGKIDEIGPLVETQYGYHIIKVTARTEKEVKPLDEEVRKEIVDRITFPQKREVALKFLDDLTAKADVKMMELKMPAPPAGKPAVAPPAPKAPAVKSAPAAAPAK